MKATFTNLEITRLAYSETSPAERFQQNSADVNREYKILKRMQKTVDNCITEPSRQSIDKILAALNNI